MNDFELERFWANDELAHRENCFYKAPQVALGIRMSDECVFAELGEEGDPWGYTPLERRIDLNKRYNDLSEKIVGRRLLREKFLPDDANLPYVKRIGEVFGGRDHTTIMHSCKVMENAINKDSSMKNLVNTVKNRVQNAR